jgi:hypothetical protein
VSFAHFAKRVLVPPSLSVESHGRAPWRERISLRKSHFSQLCFDEKNEVDRKVLLVTTFLLALFLRVLSGKASFGPK